MDTKRRYSITAFSVVAMLFMILDAQSALDGAREGINIAIFTVVPSLFPFIFIAGLLNNTVLGKRITALQKIGRFIGVPEGAESLLLLGFAGGYPIGAQMIADSFRSGQLDKPTAHRLLGFCSNAGPAFLFGMLSPVFSKPFVPFILWGVHIISALIVGLVLPGKGCTVCRIPTGTPVGLPAILDRSIKTIARICGWVILFRILIAACEHWFLWLLPTAVQVAITGLLELSNGCVALQEVSSEALRIVLCSCMLSFGGLCVGMQTVSATKGLGTGMYFPGKMLQMLVSLILILPVSLILYPDSNRKIPVYVIAIAALSILCIVILLLTRQKKLWQSARG